MADTQSYFPSPEAKEAYRQELIPSFPEACGAVDPNMPLCSRIGRVVSYIADEVDYGAKNEDEGRDEAKVLGREYAGQCTAGLSGKRFRCGFLMPIDPEWANK